MEMEKTTCKKILAGWDNTTTVLYVFSQLIVTLPAFHRSNSSAVKAVSSIEASGGVPCFCKSKPRFVNLDF